MSATYKGAGEWGGEGVGGLVNPPSRLKSLGCALSILTKQPEWSQHTTSHSRHLKQLVPHVTLLMPCSGLPVTV